MTKLQSMCVVVRKDIYVNEHDRLTLKRTELLLWFYISQSQ